MRAGNAERCGACDVLVLGPLIEMDESGEHWLCHRCADELAAYHEELEREAEEEREEVEAARHAEISAEIRAIARGGRF